MNAQEKWFVVEEETCKQDGICVARNPMADFSSIYESLGLFSVAEKDAIDAGANEANIIWR